MVLLDTKRVKKLGLILKNEMNMKRLIVYFLLTITIACDVYAQKGFNKLPGKGSEYPIGIGGNVHLGTNPRGPETQERPNIQGEVNGGLSGSERMQDNLGGIPLPTTTLNADLLDILNPWGNSQPNLRKIVISPSAQSTVRGLDNKNLSGSLTRFLSEQNIEKKLQKEESSQKWKEKLRERVHDKRNKVNRMKTKGDIYMIYGHIIIIYDNGEYYTNYAA